MRAKIYLGAALFHLTLVVLGAAYFDYASLGKLGSVLRFYGMASGANSSYGFFTGSVGSQVRATFEIIDAHGHKQPVELYSGNSHEADLRVTGIMGEFATDEDDAKRFQRSLAASLAGTLFGRYPGAREVIVRLEEFTPVSMKAYREGKRPSWKELYEVTFAPTKGRVR